MSASAVRGDGSLRKFRLSRVDLPFVCLTVGYGLFKALSDQTYSSAMSTAHSAFLIINSVEFSVVTSFFIIVCAAALAAVSWHRPSWTLRVPAVACMAALAGVNLASAFGAFAGLPPNALAVGMAAVYGIASIVANAAWLVPIARFSARRCLAALAAAFFIANVLSPLVGGLPGVSSPVVLAALGLVAAALFAVGACRESCQTATVPGAGAARDAGERCDGARSGDGTACDGGEVAAGRSGALACAKAVLVELAGPLAVYVVLNMVLGLIAAFQVTGSQAVDGSAVFKSVASAVASLLLVFVAVFAWGMPNIRKAFSALFPVVAPLLMALPFMDHVYGALFGALLMFMHGMVGPMVLFMLLEASKRHGIPVVATVGAISLASRVFLLAGMLVGDVLAAQGQLDATVRTLIVAMVAIYLLSLVLVWLLRGRRAAAPALEGALCSRSQAEGIDARDGLDAFAVLDGLAAGEDASSFVAPVASGPGGAPTAEAASGAAARGNAGGSASAPASAPADADPIGARAEELAASHRLTARESDVALLLARGRSAAYIGDELGISANTVRGHVKSVYAKLGVHSKQELIDLYTA